MAEQKLKQIFMTGATSGFGLVVACELAAAGNTIIAIARSGEKGNFLLENYKNNYLMGKGKIEIVLCDLSSFESIVNACNEVKAKYNYLDTLINNAGIWNFSYRESKNKIEETLHVNVLAPLLISHLLIDLLIKSKEAKIIFTASGLHQGDVNFNDLESKNNFSGFKAYRQSKLEVILLCRLLAEKLKSVNVGVYCQHPGMVNTKLGRDAGWFSNLIFKLMGQSPEKGARNLLYVVTEDKSRLVSGEYYAFKKVKRITPQSYDMQTAHRLNENLKPYINKYLGVSSPIFQ